MPRKSNVIPIRRTAGAEPVMSLHAREYEQFVRRGMAETKSRVEAIRRANEAICWLRDGLSFEDAWREASRDASELGAEDEPVLAAPAGQRERLRELLGEKTLEGTAQPPGRPFTPAERSEEPVSKAERGEPDAIFGRGLNDPREERREPQQGSKAAAGDSSASSRKAAQNVESRSTLLRGSTESPSRGGSEVRGTSPPAVAPLSEAEAEMLAPLVDGLGPRLFLAPAEGAAQLTEDCRMTDVDRRKNDELDARYLALITARGPLLNAEIVTQLKCDRSDEHRSFLRLKAAGKIHSVGRTNAARVHLGSAPGIKARDAPKLVLGTAPKVPSIPGPPTRPPLLIKHTSKHPAPPGVAPVSLHRETEIPVHVATLPVHAMPQSSSELEAQASALEKRAIILRKVAEYWAGLEKGPAP